jgi:nicotinamide riboside kinase
MRRRPRIGVTGSAGTGKTTLAARLSRDLDLPLRDEAMRQRLVAGFDFHAITRGDHRGMLATDTDDLARALAAGDGLVTDRTPLDMAAFWLSNGFGVDDPVATESLLSRAVCAMADYSLVVLLPWADLPLAADGVRGVNPWMQLHFQTVLEGLCGRYVAPSRLLSLSGVVDEDARLERVRGRLDASA